MTRKYQPAGPARYAHQQRGLRKLIETGGVSALLFDPGTGKTAVALDYACILALTQQREVKVLVVSPLAAVDTWITQAAIFVHPAIGLWAEAIGGGILERGQALASRGGNPFKTTPARGPRGAWQGPRATGWHRAWDRLVRLGAGSGRKSAPSPAEGPDGLGTDTPRLLLEIINIDTLSSRARHGSGTMADYMIDAIRRYGPDLLIVDESHKIKSANGNASRLLARTTPFVPRRIILTGTVMPHGPLDVFGQWRFLDPTAFGTRLADGSVRNATATSFKSRFARLGGWMGKEVIGYQNLDDMQAIMARRAVVVRKKDALDLPPTQDVTVPVRLSAGEARAYAQMKQQLISALLAPDGQFVQATAATRLVQLMRLRQITSGFVIDDSGRVVQLGSSKTATITSIVHDNLAGEKRIVVFAHFIPEIAMLTRALARKDTEVMVITGATHAEDRMLLRKRFGTSTGELPQRIVMIAQVKTMSLAVNELITANHAIFASLSQQRDDLIQARDRLDRIGQERPVTFWYALAPHTVDEVILRSHRDRTDLESAMLKHISEGEKP